MGRGWEGNGGGDKGGREGEGEEWRKKLGVEGKGREVKGFEGGRRPPFIDPRYAPAVV